MGNSRIEAIMLFIFSISILFINIDECRNLCKFLQKIDALLLYGFLFPVISLNLRARSAVGIPVLLARSFA